MNTQLAEADNEFILGLYRNAVAFYKPGIEKRSGVPLGNISVWDYRHFDHHFINEVERRTYPWLPAILRKFVFKSHRQKLSQDLKASFANHNCPARYFNNAIYVSFSTDIRFHEDQLAFAAVHELSYALWEKLEGKPLHEDRPGTPADREKFGLLTEGFAVYAHQVWFFDLYPASVKKMVLHWQLKPESIYFRGLQRIQELIEQCGSDILLEIPKRWRSF